MKNYLILNDFCGGLNEVNEQTFVGLIESVTGETEAIKKVKTLFNLTENQNIIAQECQIQHSR